MPPPQPQQPERPPIQPAVLEGVCVAKDELQKQIVRLADSFIKLHFGMGGQDPELIGIDLKVRVLGGECFVPLELFTREPILPRHTKE
jgi:hypothetical protein